MGNIVMKAFPEELSYLFDLNSEEELHDELCQQLSLRKIYSTVIPYDEETAVQKENNRFAINWLESALRK